MDIDTAHDLLKQYPLSLDKIMWFPLSSPSINLFPNISQHIKYGHNPINLLQEKPQMGSRSLLDNIIPYLKQRYYRDICIDCLVNMRMNTFTNSFYIPSHSLFIFYNCRSFPILYLGCQNWQSKSGNIRYIYEFRCMILIDSIDLLGHYCKILMLCE